LADTFLATTFFLADTFFLLSAAIDLPDHLFSPAPDPSSQAPGEADLLWSATPGKCGRASYREVGTTGWIRSSEPAPGLTGSGGVPTVDPGGVA
ncbi:MAG: hypothetical protein CL436_05110, partial [Acidimicrobiaceae bacterium]|nr:hypothetical protein [Acidimicrobiaceae bacterium]